MSNDDNADALKIVIKIAKAAPQSNFYLCLYIIIKNIPFFLITHDLNINSKLGLSYFVRKMSLGELVAAITNRVFTFIIELACLIICIIGFILLFHLSNQHRKYNRFSIKQKKLISLIAFFIYLFNIVDQYIYAMIIESVFCKRGTINNSDSSSNTNKPPSQLEIDNDNSCFNALYYCHIIIGVLLMLYSVLGSFSVNVFTSSPYFNSNNLFISSLKMIDIYYIMSSLYQIVLQLEFHLSLNTILAIKHVIRSLIILDYCFQFYAHKRFFTCYCYEYVFFWFKSACAVSIIIEWIFYFDINNALIILIKTPSMIAMKMIIELLISWLLVNAYLSLDNKPIVNFILSIATQPVLLLIETANKLFYYIYYGNNERVFSIIVEAIQENYKNNIHSPKCIKDCLSCNDYADSIDLFHSQYLELRETFGDSNINKGKRKRLSIKTRFPLVYKMLEYIIVHNYERQLNYKRFEYINSLFLLVLFYYAFEENYYKSLFYIEKITKTSLYKKNIVFKIQITLFRNDIYSHYKNKRNEIEVNQYKDDSNMSDVKLDHILQMNCQYKSIEKIIKAENYLKQTVEAYASLLSSFAADNIPYSSFLKLNKQFKSRFDLTEASLPLLMKGKECSVPYSSSKIDLLYSFLSTNSSLSIKNYDKFFNINRLPSNLDKDKNPYVIVLSAHYQSNKMQFRLDYVSDQLVNILKYTPEEFKNKTLEDLLFKTFIRPYCYLIEHSIKEGHEIINIANFCLVDKEHYAMMFNFTGVTIFSQNTLKIFVKVEESNEQLNINFNKKSRNRGRNKLKIGSLCNYCFLFTNKHGKIVSICRDFESLFFLSSKTIKKYHINIKEILRIEQLNKKGTIVKDLSTLYDNIIDNNISKIGSIGEDEYSKQVDRIKEMQQILKVQQQQESFVQVQVVVNYEEKRLIKGKGLYKKFYLFIISLNNNHSNTVILNHFNKDNSITSSFHNTLTKLPLPLSSSGPYNNNNNSMSMSRSHLLREMLFLIRCFSYKYLYLKYNIKKTVDKKELHLNNKDYIETVVNEKGFSIKESHNSTKLNQDIAHNYLTKRKGFSSKIVTNIKTPIGVDVSSESKFKYLPKFPRYTTRLKILNFVFPLVSITLLMTLSILKIEAIGLQTELFTIHGHFLMIRNTFNEIIAITLYMLFQSNHLQSKTIDHDNFDNSFDYYKSKIDGILSEFIIDYKFIWEFHGSNKEVLNSFYSDLLSTTFDMTLMSTNFTKIKVESNFMSEHYMAIYLRQLDFSEPVILFFNTTNDVYVNTSINYYAEEVYVRIIENHITIIRAMYNELIDSFDNVLVVDWFKKELLLAQQLIIVSIILAVYGIGHCIYNFYQMRFIFGRYFICFVELRYFHLYLLSKTTKVLEYIINNGDNRDIKAICQQITISNHQQELMQLKKTLSETLDNLHLLRVKPFYPQTIDNNTKTSDYCTASSKGDLNNSLMHSSVVNNTSLRSINSGTFNSILSSQKRFKKLSNNLPINLKLKGKEPVVNPINISTLSNKGGNSTTASNVNMISIMSCNNTTNYNTPNTLLSRQANNGDQNGKRLLSKPLENIANCFISITMILLFLSITLIDIIMTYTNVNYIQFVFHIEATVFNHMNYLNELLLTYQISILKNTELTFDYKSHGYFNQCISDINDDNNNRTNTISNTTTTYELFEVIHTCFEISKKKIEPMITGGFASKKEFKEINEYIELSESELFCENYAKSYYKNRDMMKSSSEYKVNKSNDEIYNELLANCQMIGGGLNSKGLFTALDTMHMTLVNLYHDFKNDLTRTSISNLKRLNDDSIQSFQVEMVHLLFNLPIQFLISFQNDFDLYENNSRHLKMILVTIQALLFLLMFGFLILKVQRIEDNEENIEFLEKCIVNTIFF